jgi:hypothetical protein
MATALMWLKWSNVEALHTSDLIHFISDLHQQGQRRSHATCVTSCDLRSL